MNTGPVLIVDDWLRSVLLPNEVVQGFAGVAPNRGIPGNLMQNQLPHFWSDSLSRVSAQARPFSAGQACSEESKEKGVGIRKEAGTSIKDKLAKAKQIEDASFTYGEIARALGVIRSQAFRLVNETQ